MAHYLQLGNLRQIRPGFTAELLGDIRSIHSNGTLCRVEAAGFGLLENQHRVDTFLLMLSIYRVCVGFAKHEFVSLSRLDLMRGLAPAGEVLSCSDKKVPKETFPKSPPFGCPALLAPGGLCRQAFHGLTAKLRASCAQPCGLFLPPLCYSAGIDGIQKNPSLNLTSTRFLKI